MKSFKRRPASEWRSISSPAVLSKPRATRPPRSIAWVLLVASAAAVLMTGLAATALVVADLAPSPALVRRPTFWLWLIVACGFTLVSLGLRALRWIFLLRRSEARFPIRDAYIGYLAGFALLLAPLLLGEIAVRAYVHRERGHVPVRTTIALNVWERLLDVVALTGIGAVLAFMAGQGGIGIIGLVAGVAATMIPSVRRALLRAIVAVIGCLPPLGGRHEPSSFGRLAGSRAWLVALVTSVVAWLLPGAAFWVLASGWGYSYGLIRAETAFAFATLGGGFALAPGGILVTGRLLLAALREAGFPDSAAALSVMGIRLASAGLATALGGVFLFVHLRSRPANAAHFDEIADVYDVQIPPARRDALLARKTELMRELLTTHGIGRAGLDVGCGQGRYVGRMRELGFDVVGIDSSPGQVALAARNLGAPNLTRLGSALSIPAADRSYDFAYSINVLHHLSSTGEQRAAFLELLRVVRPGGLIFLHEINTRNPVFRFYMGYVFPSLNCIDEGVERWLLPNRLARYTNAPLIDVRYFTFLPEFAPASIVRWLAPLERRLEASRLRMLSAHYMAVFRRPE